MRVRAIMVIEFDPETDEATKGMSFEEVKAHVSGGFDELQQDLAKDGSTVTLHVEVVE